MPQVPFHLRYELNRRQRLVPHLVIWRPGLGFIVLTCVGSLLLAIFFSWWFLLLVIWWLWLFRNFFRGLLDVILHRVVQMDVLVEEKGLGFLASGERWWLFLDGITAIDKLCKDTWTVQHFNGTVVHIPTAAITEAQIEHLKSAAERGLWCRRSSAQQESPEHGELQHTLSVVGAWVFVASALAMLVAHLLAYHTLGTVFGLASMLTGTCMALMTWRERASRWVLAATAALLVGGGVIIWAFEINVRDELQKWEERERRLGRPPWGASEPEPESDGQAGPAFHGLRPESFIKKDVG